MTWLLVFWLTVPENYTPYTKYNSEVQCESAAQVWNARLQKVQAKLVAECRRVP